MTESERVILELVADGFFSIDEKGQIWRHRKMSPTGDQSQVPISPVRRAESAAHDGYLRIGAGHNWQALAHRVVYMHFFGEIPDGMEINHENGKRADNAPSNLTLMTPKENCVHSGSGSV